jgi:hypothetical protein
MMDQNTKKKTIILGVVIGALTGVASAYILIKRAEDEEKNPELTPGEGIQLGLGVLGLLRLIAGHGKS